MTSPFDRIDRSADQLRPMGHRAIARAYAAGAPAHLMIGNGIARPIRAGGGRILRELSPETADSNGS